MSDNLDKNCIENYLNCPMSSEPERNGGNTSDGEMDLGNDSSDYDDDTDDDPDFLPSESEESTISDEGSEIEMETEDSQVQSEQSFQDGNGDNGDGQGGTGAGGNEDEDDGWNFFQSKQQHFTFTGMPRFNFNLPNNASPVDFYKIFLNNDITQMMVLETNRNASNVIRDTRLRRSSRLRKWRETNELEMQKFIGILIWMGLARYPRITDYWSRNMLYKNSVGSQVMSRNRFQLMLRFWHFNDNAVMERDGRISKILPLVTKLNELFLSKKSAEQDLVVDETMIPFRGRLSFRQYIPNKAHKYGIKVFKLCDKTGYTFNTKIYMGKGTVRTENKNEQVSKVVVMELMTNHLDKGQNLCVDNYYTSLPLAQELLAKQTHLVGTVRANRKGLPAEVMKAKLKKGEMVALESVEGIVVSKWKDKREVRMLSTRHGLDYVDTGKTNKKNQPILKPLVVMEYNKSKSGIDISDQMSSYSTGVRKSKRWYHKVAEELLLGTAVVNSWLAFTDTVKAKPTASGNRKKYCMSITTFKEQVAMGLMGLQDEVLPPVKSTGHHYLTVSEMFTGQGKAKHRVRKYCKKCYKKTVDEKGRQGAKNLGKVNTFCDQCPEKPYLCQQCFREIHK